MDEDGGTKISSDPGADGALDVIHFLVKDIEWIRMLSSRLSSCEADPARFRRDVERIRELSSAVAGRMRRFLHDARCPGERPAELVEIGSLVDEAVHRIEQRGGRRAISARVDEDVRGSKVPSQLLIAVVAVLENAVDFSGEDGEVLVRVRNDGEDLLIAIEDSGRGMEHDVLSACTARGFTTRGNRGGHGFGLYSASQILARNDGDLTLESKVGAGTRALLTTSRTRMQGPGSGH